jgi:small subunit ribosomal protein S6
MRRYESVVILDPELPEDDVKNLTERFRRLVGEFGGEIIKIENWGLRRLAYLVKRRDRGRYVFFDYVGAPALLAEMERQFKIAEEVLKYLSVKLDDNVDLEAFKAEAGAREAAAQAEAPAEDATARAEPVEETAVAAPSSPAEPEGASSSLSGAAEPVESADSTPAGESLESDAPNAQADAAPPAPQQSAEAATPTGGES